MSDVDVMWKTEVVDEITGSPTTTLLAVRYWECNGSAVAFRPYLDIRIPAHRIALTRALTATHQLAVERGKWHGVSREWLLCRMCSNDVEDVPHVLFVCPFPPRRPDTQIVLVICVGPISQLEGEGAIPDAPPSSRTISRLA
ncbi:uncharacterized protein ARMOST_05751 [Armillaria ostoyae]|uniref:Uncharacterized protein n=1 Tax=Armillaria ostoyae TaxID=47428 RepID=A0A284R136_ARMOS|nr:uncharacterized protein ARMOST_05751 [Armillaria ostoyae]